jgi:hypothetical protein
VRLLSLSDIVIPCVAPNALPRLQHVGGVDILCVSL